MLEYSRLHSSGFDDVPNGGLLPDDWGTYRRLVLAELERLDDEQTKQAAAIAKLNTAVALLNLRAGIWGGLAGLIPICLYLAIRALKIP